MNVETTSAAEIAIRALDQEDRLRVHSWLQQLRNWGNDPHTMKISKKMPNSDLHVLKGTNDIRIFFNLDEANSTITVVDVAKHSVLGTAV